MRRQASAHAESAQLHPSLPALLAGQGRAAESFPVYANAGIAITASADAESWKFTAPNGACPVSDVDALVARLQVFENIGVQHLRINFQGETPRSQLDLMQQTAEKVLPAFR